VSGAAEYKFSDALVFPSSLRYSTIFSSPDTPPPTLHVLASLSSRAPQKEWKNCDVLGSPCVPDESKHAPHLTLLSKYITATAMILPPFSELLKKFFNNVHVVGVRCAVS
jgi:2'-5' RNA ligase